MSKIVLTAGNKLATLDTIDNELNLASEVLKFVKEAGTEAQVNLIVREEMLSRLAEILLDSSPSVVKQPHTKIAGLYIVKI